MRTEFTKYEGAGNDFILIDNRDGVFTPEAEAIARHAHEYISQFRDKKRERLISLLVMQKYFRCTGQLP